MDTSQHDFAAAHYGPRAHDYLTSVTHASGADLDEMEALAQRRAPARLLDLGCGGGHVSFRAAAWAGAVVACDITPEMLDVVAGEAAARGLANIATQLGAAEHLPFADGMFDMVVSRFSAHHWPELEAGLSEAARVLRPGGVALFIDTVAPRAAALDTHLQAVELLRDPSHVRNYRVDEWVAALGRAGFAVAGRTARRLQLEFSSWITRTRTQPAQAAAVQRLQAAASGAVWEHFEIGADGSFTIDTMSFEAVIQGGRHNHAREYR